ncbi:hypothetical protein [Bacillus toyonensis]|uniref:hypothetical protein n=1 Tax=Bacillus toyonensis TaxID=155322 RepID=UPI000BF2A7CB|nr:hypothetical protein [Bacillus toyonensis]PGA05154.1 hypothetical protein COL67_19935 [Bacillus toyonensis]
MRQADLVKIINREYGSKISQKVVKERIDKLYNFIKSQIISNEIEFSTNEKVLFNTCIKSIEEKNFHEYTGAIFLSLLILYENNLVVRKVIRGKIVNDDYLEGFIGCFETYVEEYKGKVFDNNGNEEKRVYLTESEKKIWRIYEEDFPYFMFILKGMVTNIFSNTNILNKKKSVEIRYTASLVEHADQLPPYRHYLFAKRLNRKLELLLKSEKSILKKELRTAIIKRDFDAMDCIIADLNFEPDYIGDNKKEIEILNALKEVLQSRYKLNLKTMSHFEFFQKNVLRYRAEERMKIIQELQEIVNSKEKREVLSFLERINQEGDKKVEREKKKIQEEYKMTKKLFLRAGRLKSKTEMHRILNERTEYRYLERNDKQLYNAIEKLMVHALKEENLEVLLKIDSILKYYKKFFM